MTVDPYVAAVTPEFARDIFNVTLLVPLKGIPVAVASPVILNVLEFSNAVAVSAVPLKLVAKISFHLRPELPIS